MAVKKIKIVSPIQPKEFEILADTDELLNEAKITEECIRETHFENVAAAEKDYSRTMVSSSRFSNCRFLNCMWDKAEFTDVVFQNCDFSGSSLSHGYFNRVEFRSCKGVGTVLSDGIYKNLLVTDGSFDYANFDHSKLEHVSIGKTELNGSNFAQCICKNVRWQRVKLKNASFFHTSMQGMDLSDSEMNGLVLSDNCEELKGLVVDLYQAAELAKRLGIVIKDVEV